MSMSIYANGLANYLFNSNGSDPLTVLAEQKKNRVSFATDSAGKTIVPTMDAVNRASSPQAKLSLAGQMAAFIKIQSSAVYETGIAKRVPTLTAQADSVMDAIETAVSKVKTNAGSTVASGVKDSALKAYQSTISTALDSLHTIVKQLSTMTKKLSSDDASTVATTLKDIDSRAKTIATEAGLSWTSVYGSSSSTTTKSSKLVDFYA